MYGISKSQVFVSGIFCGPGSLFQSARGPCRLESFATPSDPSRHGPLRTSFATAMRRSSVSATDRPPRRCLPRLNCHSHWLISYTLARDVASLPAGLAGCICQPMWKPGAPVLAELVWDGLSRVADTLNGF